MRPAPSQPIPAGWPQCRRVLPGNSTKTLPPDFFASDAMLYEVNQSNVSQYAHLLSDGVQALIAKGFSCPVYPSHRTVCYPDIRSEGDGGERRQSHASG